MRVVDTKVGSRGGRCTFWRENEQNLVMDWRWSMNEKEVPKMTDSQIPDLTTGWRLVPFTEMWKTVGGQDLG